MTGKRIEYLDILRILASLAVIIIHVSSQYMYAVSVGSFSWNTFKAYHTIASWAVPVFCMISGCLFLSRDISITTIIRKYVFHIATIFIVWSLFYAVVFESTNGIGSLLSSFVKGYSHLWFLYMIASLYLLTPILRKIALDKELTRYFIIVGVVFNIIIPELINFIGLVSDKASSYLFSAYGNIELQALSGYVLYYVLGYYICHLTDNNQVKLLTLIGIPFFMISPAILLTYASLTGVELSFLTGNFSIGNFSRSVSIFSAAKYISSSKKASDSARFISLLAYNSLGAYLVQQFVITTLNRTIGLNTLSFNPILSVAVISGITFVIAYFISIILHKIPGLRRIVI